MSEIYYITGTAYAGKSTMVKLLAEKYDGIACEENYHDRLVDEKDALVDKLISLDGGFENLYREVADELKDNMEKYSVQIKQLQEKMRQPLWYPMRVAYDKSDRVLQIHKHLDQKGIENFLPMTVVHERENFNVNSHLRVY